MTTTLVPPGRWVPIDAWFIAAQQRQRDDYGSDHHPVAEVLESPAVPAPHPPRGAAARRRARKALTGTDAL